MWWLAIGDEDYVPGGIIENISYRDGQKQPQFFQLSLADVKLISTKESFPQKIEKLEQVSDYVFEVAITFDKPYTYREILKMVPDNLLLNWLSLSRSVDATFSGIILSGRNENFKQLQDKSWIAASSIGATARYFPYLPTTK